MSEQNNPLNEPSPQTPEDSSEFSFPPEAPTIPPRNVLAYGSDLHNENVRERIQVAHRLLTAEPRDMPKLERTFANPNKPKPDVIVVNGEDPTFGWSRLVKLFPEKPQPVFMFMVTGDNDPSILSEIFQEQIAETTGMPPDQMPTFTFFNRKDYLPKAIGDQPSLKSQSTGPSHPNT
jgi:hypothetical protein